MKAEAVKLGELLEVQNGFAFKKEFFSDVEGKPLIRIRDIDKSSTEAFYTGEYREEFLVQEGDYLIGMDGEFTCRKWKGREALLNQRVCRLRNFSARVLPEYVYFGIQPALTAIEGTTSFVTVKHISGKQILDIELPLPDIQEQRRIVDILSRAEGIVRLRRDAQHIAAELVPAIFLDFFGNPASNPKGWPKVSLGDYLTIESAVRTPNHESEASSPCIGADSIESGTGKIVSWPTVEQIKPISGKYHFKKNDVLYSKIRPALMKTIVAPESGFCSADMYPLRPKSGIATPEFVAALLLSKAFTEYAIGVSARAQMPKVNRETLFAYEHPMPPITLQEAFANRIQGVNSIQRQQESALAQSELVFASLLGKSFS
jgi:type I restriction enzyme S subunit